MGVAAKLERSTGCPLGNPLTTPSGAHCQLLWRTFMSPHGPVPFCQKLHAKSLANANGRAALDEDRLVSAFGRDVCVFLFQAYYDLLGGDLAAEEIYVRSTDYTRTLEVRERFWRTWRLRRALTRLLADCTRQSRGKTLVDIIRASAILVSLLYYTILYYR